jgi:hypothetical protein
LVLAEGLIFKSGSSPEHRVFTEATARGLPQGGPFCLQHSRLIFFGLCFWCAFFRNNKFETMHMTRSAAAIVAWVESQPTANLVMIVYWCSIAITFMCEIASITILATISTNNLEDESDSWMAVWFFAVDGGIAWIVARQCLDSVHRGATRSQPASWPTSESAGRKASPLGRDVRTDGGLE